MSIWLKNQPWNDVNISRSAVAKEIEWNLWQTRQPPFTDLDIGDVLFLAVGGHGEDSLVLWETRVAGVVRRRYKSLPDAARILIDEFGSKAERVIGDPAGFRYNFEYNMDRPSSGWLLGLIYEPIRRLDPPVPRGPELHVGQNGWADLTDLTDRQLQRLGLIPEDWHNKRPPRTRAGRMSESARRIAVELHAMKEARRHLRDTLGYEDSEITDTSADRPYDYECHHDGLPPLRVEVKGTTGAGSSVLVTRGEVDHARDGEITTALFICSEIELTTNKAGEHVARGGTTRWIDPWRPTPARLRAESYTYYVTS